MQVETLTPNRYAEAAALLARAFENDPLTLYLLPRAGASRLARLAWVYERWMRVVGPLGGAFITSGGEGAALWWPPGGHDFVTTRRILRAGLGWAPFRVGLRYCRRMLTAARDVETRHMPAFAEPYWYLDMLGVDPARQRTGAGAALIRHVTDRVERKKSACYVVTHNPANVPYYERFGFEVLHLTTIVPGLTAFSLGRF